MVKDPDTGKRISRPNAESDWQATDVPDLAIVSRELFEAAQKRKKARSVTHPNRQRRPRHILSGLLKCGACGSGMASNGKDRSGRVRIRCSAARLGELTREIDRLVDAIAKGQGDPAVLGPRSTFLHCERMTITADLAESAPAIEPIGLHPAMLARYEEQLTRLQAAVAGGIRDGDTECSEALRDLVETVTVFRNRTRSGGVQVEISGRLTALLGERAYPNKVRGVWGKMVAEEGFEPQTQGL